MGGGAREDPQRLTRPFCFGLAQGILWQRGFNFWHRALCQRASF